MPKCDFVARAGVEPTTLGFKVLRATIAPSGNLLLQPIIKIYMFTLCLSQ